MRICTFVLVLLTITISVAASVAQAQDNFRQTGGYGDAYLDPVFSVLPENVEILRLENGLEVVLMHNPAQPMVGVYTQVKVGSAWEDYRTSGMSHMLEHLLFNGSDKYTQDELYELTDQAGAYNNANTSNFFTNYMIVLPASELAKGLDIQSQMLFHSTLPDEKFEKERGIVLGELVQARDRSGHFTDETLRQVLFAGSSLELPTLGTRSTIAHMERADVYAFYKHWYVPNNMVLTLAGNFERDSALELLERFYGEAAPGSLDRRGLQKLQHLDRTRTVVRRGGDRRSVALAFEAPTYGMPDFFPFLIMTELLQLDGSGVLTRAMDDLDRPEAWDLGTYWEAAEGFGRLVMEFELPKEADPTSCYRLVQDAVSAALEQGLDPEDILGSVRMAETQTLLQREQLRMTGIYIAESLALGGVDYFVSYLDRLRAVTPEQVSQALAGWLVDAPCLAVLVEPAAGNDDEDAGQSAGMPGGMQMPAGMQMPPGMAAAMKARGMDGGQTDEAPEGDQPEEPVPTVWQPLQVDRAILDNGAVLVSQTNEDSPLVAIHLAVRGRAMVDRDNAQAGALDLVHRLLAEGVAGCDATCLARRLRQLGAVVKLVDNPHIPMDNYYTNGRFSFIRIETTAANGLAVLELLVSLIQHGSFTDEDFQRVRQEQITVLERDQSSTRSRASALLDEALYGEHPLVLPPEGSPLTLGELDFNQIRVVYRKAFAPENLIFAVVGPLAHQELRDNLERLLPGRGKPTPGLPPLPLTSQPATVTDTMGGELAAIRLGSIFPADSADRPALGLLVSILSDRLAMDLRETRGLSYRAGAGVSVVGETGTFTAYLNPPVERLDEGREALTGFISGFDAATITQEELDTIRSARRGRLMLRRLSSMSQAYYLAMAELENDIAGYLEAVTAYDGVQLADLQRVAGRYLTGMNLVEVVVD